MIASLLSQDIPDMRSVVQMISIWPGCLHARSTNDRHGLHAVQTAWTTSTRRSLRESAWKRERWVAGTRHPVGASTSFLDEVGCR
jgi:hypothetical protein